MVLRRPPVPSFPAEAIRPVPGYPSKDSSLVQTDPQQRANDRSRSWSPIAVGGPHCWRCGQGWDALGEAHCASCHEHFVSTSAFDAHRVARTKGDVSTNYCWPLHEHGGLTTANDKKILVMRFRPATLLADGSQKQGPRRLWGSPEMTAAEKEAAFPGRDKTLRG